MAKKKLTDREIEEQYDIGGFRISQERSDFLLPQIIDFVKTKRWLNTRPEYQRRLVWDNKKKSRLIESLLMNVPIPPVFLFESDLNRYEVMDGQQRLNSIIEFYENRLKLNGLEHWESLNGRLYADLPPRIQRGLDRRRISAAVLLAESGGDTSVANELRRLVFERLNTGGQSLNAQELRNCIYAGVFNDLLVDLAGSRRFNVLWEIPAYADHIRGEHVSAELANNSFYRRMQDVEIVLRFFAFSVPKSKLKGSVKSLLDKCMEEHADDAPDTIASLSKIFLSRIELAFDIFGPDAFKLPRTPGTDRLSAPLYDAIMVALDRLFENRGELVKAKGKIARLLKDKLQNDSEFYALVVGRANTSEALRARIDNVEALMRSQI